MKAVCVGLCMCCVYCACVMLCIVFVWYVCLLSTISDCLALAEMAKKRPFPVDKWPESLKSPFV